MSHGRIISSVLLALSVSLAGAGMAVATPVTDSTDQKQLENFTSEQAHEVELAAKLFKELSRVESGKEKEEVLVDNVGEEETAEAAAVVGLTPDELFSDETVANEYAFGLGGTEKFLSCMEGKVEDDVKEIFHVNAIAVLIGQEKYFEAAEEAVAYLAKQGVKRNAAAIASVLAFYGARCAFCK
ncbi:hypothetical protein [Corynebacterium pseudokroppenstedtii]|nr:hypothetical protein [Corynebacterium pseudokroppenstedtii]